MLRGGEKLAVHAVEPDVAELPIAHRDRDAIVVEKPAGVPSQATRAGVSSVETWVRRREPAARLVHRLDRAASGLLLFSRREEARARFAGMLERGELRRIYRAVVWGEIPSERMTIDRPVGPDPRDRRRQTAGVGRPARTDVCRLRTGRSAAGRPISLVELRLHTGRTHQIRVHMASIGCAVCGDPLYSPAVGVEAVERLALWCHRLEWPGAVVESSVSPVIAALVDVLT